MPTIPDSHRDLAEAPVVVTLLPTRVVAQG